VRVLEERERLVAILDRTLETRGVRIVLPGDPDEEGTSSLGVEQLSLVSAPYAVDAPGGRGARVAGSVGVLGPTRMDYAAIVPIVNETARQVGALLSREERKADEDE
jgi:heat-inducible transcriptional repressor